MQGQCHVTKQKLQQRDSPLKFAGFLNHLALLTVIFYVLVENTNYNAFRRGEMETFFIIKCSQRLLKLQTIRIGATREHSFNLQKL